MRTIALCRDWVFRRIGEVEWLPATVPGCVHTDLLAAGRIDDPFYRTNEKGQGWIERQSWEWRTHFHADEALLSSQRIEMVFEGLDTYADVFVNEQPVLAADNMFRRWRLPLTGVVRAGDNELRVRFHSPVLQARRAHQALGFELEAINDQGDPKLSVFTRKAPYHYGWDWGPRFVTSGIWRPVRIEAWDDARIEDLHVLQQSLDDTQAALVVVIAVESAHAGEAAVSAGVVGGERTQQTAALSPGRNEVRLALRIEQPRRWWPNGLGEPHLYTIEATVETARAQQVAQRRIGLRTVHLVHERDAQGKSFTFEVNGVPVFMKGANWIPADSFPSRMTADRYRALLASAAQAHMNMLRVWGGGIYEDDCFYDLCDELGILVWQDFMFACSLYPDDQAFVDNVRHEAIDNVIRLRNHACLALWAGNNEIETAWHHWGWKFKYAARGLAARAWAGYERLFHQVLPEVVRTHDPGRPYTRSSPNANEEGHTNERGWGDMHYWGVWHLKLPHTAYDDNISRFMSEYGFQSLPERETVAHYTRPEDRHIDSEVMRAHQRHHHGNALIAAYLAKEFPPPRDFEAFLYLGQLLQAEIIKYGAESHRRAMPLCMGSLYWQLDDCWPVASWSGIDYFGRWKALHFYARRFFAPVLVTVRQERGAVVIHGLSDHLEPFAATLRLRALTFAGHTLWAQEAHVRLPPNAVTLLHRAPLSALIGKHPPRDALVVAELVRDGARVSRNLLYLAPTKKQVLPRPTLRLDARAAGNALRVIVSSDHLARHLWLTSAAAGSFSDNGFDLLPGETSEVVFTPAGTVDAEVFRRNLRVTTLVDAF